MPGLSTCALLLIFASRPAWAGMRQGASAARKSGPVRTQPLIVESPGHFSLTLGAGLPEPGALGLADAPGMTTLERAEATRAFLGGRLTHAPPAPEEYERFILPLERSSRDDRVRFQRFMQGAKSAVRRWDLPVEELFSEHDVLYLGENHAAHSSSLQLLTDTLPRLKAAGVTHIALEEISFEHELLLAPPGTYHHALHSAARAAGIQFVCFGVPEQTIVKAIIEKAAEQLGDFAYTLPFDLYQLVQYAESYVPGLNEAVADVVFQRRDALWTRRLLQALQGGGKAVALGGFNHMRPPEGFQATPKTTYWLPRADYGYFTDRLRAKSVKTFSVALTGGSISGETARAIDQRILKPYHDLLREAAPDNGPAFLKTSDRDGVYRKGNR